jgi:tRNA 2-(methylsulfanyl)-N6-isopentenyladenosine37 hydroxylase
VRWVILVLFALTYAGITARRVALLPIGRPSVALVGACALVVAGAFAGPIGLTPDEALAAVARLASLIRYPRVTAIPLTPTAPSWVAAAVADLASPMPRLLLDHAHCEKKAAAMALRHIERHADWPRLPRRMSRLAREELVHFERVLAELRARRLRFRGQPGSGYGAALMAAVRPPTAPAVRGGPGSWLGDRTVDEMLICALIEARSHERFTRLAEALAGTPLGELYADLRDAEERHGALYLELAAEVAGGDVAPRLAELAAHEAAVLVRPGLPLRMHSGGTTRPG